MNQIICGDRLNKKFCKELAKNTNSSLIFPDYKKFPDGEIRVEFGKNVADSSIIVIKFFTDEVNNELIELFFTLSALKRLNLKNITLLLPYFPYLRSHHEKSIYSGSNLEVIMRVFEEAGVSKIITLEPHISDLNKNTKIKIINFSFLELIRDSLKSIYNENDQISFVSPDKGGEKFANDCKKLFPKSEKVVFSKVRHHRTGKVISKNYQGAVNKTCVIIDDIISSGETIKNTVIALRKNGAEKIYVYAAHAVLSKNSSQMLDNLKIKNLHVTESIPIPKSKKIKNLKIIPLVQLFSNTLGKK